MLENGRYRSAQEIADAEKIGRSFVSRLLRLTLLASDIQEAILDGRQAKGMQLEELMGAMPSEWGSSAAASRVIVLAWTAAERAGAMPASLWLQSWDR